MHYRSQADPCVRCCSIAILIVTVADWGTAAAQDYPARTITIVVPFPAGGAGDSVARTVAERMRTSLGQPVVHVRSIVTGRGPARRGARRARASARCRWHAHARHQRGCARAALRRCQARAGRTADQRAADDRRQEGTPADNLAALIAWLKANPDKASMGTGGVAATSHLAGLLFQRETGTRFTLVPYRGASMPDLVAGRIRHADRSGSQRFAARARREHPPLCCHRQEPPRNCIRDSNRRRSGLAGTSRIELDGTVCAEGHAEKHYCQD